MRSSTAILSSLCVDSPPEYGTTLYCLIIFLSTFYTETGSKLIKLICVASDSISKDNVDTDVDGEVLGTSNNLGKKNTWRIGV